MKMNAIKTKLKFLIILFIYYNSNIAQTIKPITEIGSKENGFYYKDQLQILDAYIGTWQYASGNKVLKLKLKKIINHHIITSSSTNRNYHADIIVGGYQYFENGVEVLNTMHQLNTNLPNIYDYKFAMYGVIPNHARPRCFNCDPNVLRLSVSYEEFSSPNLYSGYRTYIGIKENEPNKLIFQKYLEWAVQNSPTDALDQILPDGIYELTKIAP